MTEDMTVGWYHHQALGNGKGQRRMACGSPWGGKKSDMTELPKNSSRSPVEPTSPVAPALAYGYIITEP